MDALSGSYIYLHYYTLSVIYSLKLMTIIILYVSIILYILYCTNYERYKKNFIWLIHITYIHTYTWVKCRYGMYIIKIIRVYTCNEKKEERKTVNKIERVYPVTGLCIAYYCIIIIYTYRIYISKIIIYQNSKE